MLVFATFLKNNVRNCASEYKYEKIRYITTAVKLYYLFTIC